MGACPWKYAGKAWRRCMPVVCGVLPQTMSLVHWGWVSYWLVIRHRVAFRVAIVPCILTVFLLGVLLHSGSVSRPL
jgi:hypothetical protein